VHDAIRAVQPADVRVKWPNDVLIGLRKVAGILIENEVSGDRITCSIIGIGVNVNNVDLDNDLHATSLRLSTGQLHSRLELLESICQAFENRWSAWEDKGDGAERDYVDALWMRGRWASFELDGAPIKARPLDVDPDGRLIVELEDGRTEALGLHRIRFARRM
jgi:BirA family biotin operon repressor/biotin-[acetyl-CoA-carboxylase] ligase